MSLLCLALRPLLARFAVDGPAFTSIFQGATRWQTYVALAVSSNLYGDVGLALASVAMVAIIPLVNVFSVAVLASSSAYVLARQMGGDAPLLAQIITLQTILAAITMPIAIALVA